jgi:TusA-related sulfurtransferase
MQREELKIVIRGTPNSDRLKSCEVSKTVDTRGMACPYPSFESVKAVSTPNDDTDSCIEIITDSEESALKSIPTVCQNRKWQFLVLEEAINLWRVRIKK